MGPLNLIRGTEKKWGKGEKFSFCQVERKCGTSKVEKSFVRGAQNKIREAVRPEREGERNAVFHLCSTLFHVAPNEVNPPTANQPCELTNSQTRLEKIVRKRESFPFLSYALPRSE